ncbi:NADP-dependent oxidoreductase domain-containing protein [Podospora didyma]|uniref:NADP-dependent oxidoreductase domain-containing protein n=1 Tax=Podospora didyma TaxID=330526 RepID=A0AAE0NTI9_9PEZI|nr:NADP-dependent oxidoreductase domain-containing protein [Podospora didyma]
MAGQPLPTSLQASLDSTKVEYVQLGTSGLRVSWPVLGAMALGSPEAAAPPTTAASMLGIRPNSYSNGLSEEMTSKAICAFKLPRSKLVLMTTCYFHVGEDLEVYGAMGRRCDRARTMLIAVANFESSFVMNHRQMPTKRALHGLVQSGKVRYIGASSMGAAAVRNYCSQYD